MQISLVELGVAAVALGLGILVGWLLGRWRTERQWAGRMSVSTAQVAAAEARLASAGTQLAGFVSDRQAREGALEDARAEVARLREEQGRLRAGLEAEQRMAAEKLALLDEAQAKLRDVFKALSADALNTNNQAFLDLARAALGEYQANAARDLEGRHRAIDDLVRPLRESLDKVDAELRAMEQVRAGAYSTLAEQLRSLSATQQALHSETANLVKALRAPTVRGRWGEIQLKRVVEMAGMLDHCDFYEQQSGATEQGRLVPDLVVRLPGDRHIVVDAKVPLMAYLEALDASDDAGREARMKDHARHVRQHMARLSSKAYWEQFQPAPEFVVMFLPGETFFGAALLHDPSLIEAGVDQRVILSSPITLIALLRAVAYGWRQELIARNAQDISEVGRTLYERLRVMAEHVEDIGRALDGAVAAYNHAIGSMETRVIVAARRLKEMGVGVSKDLPELQPIERAPRALQHRELVNGSAEPGAPVAPGEPV